jgi:hypothetical protein
VLKTEAQRRVSFVVLFYCYLNSPHPLPHPSGSLNPKRGGITSTSLASASLILPAATHATILPNFSLEIIMEAYFEMDNHGVNEPRKIGQDGINGRPKRRRIMTDRRREQNRQAQKNHRKYGMFIATQQCIIFDNCVGEKQKRRLQELASAEVQSKSSDTSNLSSDTGQNVSKSSFDNNDWIDVVNDNEGV